jgi:hypothetical protein
MAIGGRPGSRHPRAVVVAGSPRHVLLGRTSELEAAGHSTPVADAGKQRAAPEGGHGQQENGGASPLGRHKEP